MGQLYLRVLIDAVEKARTPIILYSIFSLLGIVALLDYLTLPGVSFAPLYIIPVLVGGWRFRTGEGVIFAVLCAVIWTAIDLADGLTLAPPIAAWNACARVFTFVLVAALVTQVRAGYDAERRAAQHDRMTGLLNGRLFEERLDALIAATESRGMTAAIAYFDLDGFKQVNDTYGHARGDELLSRIGAALSESVGEEDIAARMGGDEFAVLVRDNCPDRLERRIAGLHAVVRDVLDADRSGAGCSMGTARLTPFLSDGRSLLAVADGRLYREKRRNQRRVAGDGNSDAYLHFSSDIDAPPSRASVIRPVSG
jgi:diguanylate cyclase (GGDEF)-like protein